MAHKYKKIVRYPLRQWPALALILVLSTLTSTVTVLQPWPLKILIDYSFGETAVPMLIRSFFEQTSLSLTPLLLVIAAAIAMLGLFAINSLLDLIWGSPGPGPRQVSVSSTIWLPTFSSGFNVYHCCTTAGEMWETR
jgi:ATP-binding cassette subfamily B protein/subfamily B ATP-binding cassette protein MsbA